MSRPTSDIQNPAATSTNTPAQLLKVRRLGLQGYREVWQQMRDFTDTRGGDTQDELWLVQHPPVYTQGQAGRPEHVLNPGNIPVVQTDRGGQVTYHGPGQLVAYPLLDLRRLGFGVRELVSRLENSVVGLLDECCGAAAAARPDAPGVYVHGRKIASLGLRVRRGCSFHGISLNADMDLAPFLRIHPCGYNDLEMTQVVDLMAPGALDIAALETQWIHWIAKTLGLQWV